MRGYRCTNINGLFEQNIHFTNAILVLVLMNLTLLFYYKGYQQIDFKEKAGEYFEGIIILCKRINSGMPIPL